jgi:uncharacterized protein YecE (DUF72 family)
MRAGGVIRIGCSGWQYRHWRGTFYPPELPQARWFAHYALQFDTVEINNTFYRLPEASTFKAWREQAPPHFEYAVKASRFLTHMKKLKSPRDPLARFFGRARYLGAHLGPVLYQLPPQLRLDLARLETFLSALRSGWPNRVHVIEFRDPSWYDDRTYGLLNAYGVSLCLHDMPGSVTGKRVVGPVVYVRFHGGETKYGGAYDDRVLDEWSNWLTRRAVSGLDLHAFFNNDAGGHAPRDAIRLRQRVQRRLAA